MTQNLHDLIARVADYLVERDMEGEDWQKAVAVNGLLTTEEERFIDEARQLIDRSIETQTSTGQLSYGSLDPKPWKEDEPYQSQTDPAALAQGALEFYERTTDERYLESVEREYEFLRSAAQRTEDNGIAHHKGVTELWVDSIYMICPFLARYGLIAEEPTALNEAAHQIKIQAKYLQDPYTGLFRHQWRETPNDYPQGTFWSRGNGWAAAGILDTLQYLPHDHPERDDLINIFQRIANTLTDLQDTSGYWHNILDDPQSPLETSGTLMFVYAFMKGIEMELLDEEPYATIARDAMDVCKGVVGEEGAVCRVVGPPGGPDAPFAVTSYGQGWFLLAATQSL